MTPQQIIDYCLAKAGAYPDHPFDPDSVVVKVGKTQERSGRIFAQVFTLKWQDAVTLNCDMMTGQFYRQLDPGVVRRGYHCPPVQQPDFSTLLLDGSIPDERIIEMVDHSYHTAVGKLPKYMQKQLKVKQEEA